MSAARAARGDGTAAAELSTAWRREHACSGLTTRLILVYVEREAGSHAVARMLERAGLAALEERLRDENQWFSHEQKLALWRTAEEELSDPQLAEHVGSSVLEMTVAMGLKRTLRALGTPGFVYGNVVRANAKFNWAHELVVLERGNTSVRIRYRDVSGVGYHRCDCAFTKGLLEAVPQLFGLPRAHVTQTCCGAEDASWCEFDVRWTADTRGLVRTGLACAVGAAALATAGAVSSQPALVAAGAGVLAVTELTVGARGIAFLRKRVHALEQRVNEQDDAAARLLSSLQDLSSDLRLDEVLDQITAKARAAVGGKEFALLLSTPEGMRADRHSGIPERSLRALESWASTRRARLLHGTEVVDDLSTEPTLCELPRQDAMPFGSICAAPLLLRGELLGVLVALAHGSTVFLPGDTAGLSAYAAHAAIALSNARMVERLERQAAEDPLTGLANQRAFSRDCASAFAGMQRNGGEVSIVMLDLDHFKTINDQHGHPYGDQVLLGVADALRASIRGYDSVARMGGEEFAMLLPGAGEELALEIAERARAAVARVPVAGRTLSCSAGIATSSPPRSSPADVLELADRALYRAKALGRDRSVVSDAPTPLPHARAAGA